MTPAAMGRGYEVINECPKLRKERIVSPHKSFEILKTKLTKLNLTRRKTLRDRSDSVRMLFRSDCTRMKEALEIATSLS